MEDDAFIPVRRQYHKPAYLEVLGRRSVRGGAERPSARDRWIAVRDRCGRWIARRYRELLASIHLHEPPTISEVTSQARVLCRDFIYHRLKSQNLLTARLERQSSAASGSVIALQIQTLAAELERRYPHLYRNICRQLNVVMSSEQVLNGVVRGLADAMFNGTYVSWGRIVALFVVAGALSVECVQQGHPEFVRPVIDAFADVTKSHLADWIIQQGGWCDVKSVFRTNSETLTLWIVVISSVFLGFLLTFIMMSLF